MSISLDNATLEAALVGYQQQLQQIEAKMAELRQMLGQTPAAATPAAKPAKKTSSRKQKHRMSAEGRARIAAAQRARWAKAKKAQ
jgi:peptidoglycan hydrolase CwlO-like protein